MVYETAIIVDAGSSGSRLYRYDWDHVFSVPDEVPPGENYPNLDKYRIIKQVKKVRLGKGLSELNLAVAPGAFPPDEGPIGDFGQGETPNDLAYTVIQTYFERLFNKAGLRTAGSRAPLKLIVMATGGVRGLPELARTALVEVIERYLARSGFGDRTYKTISGRYEALYGWVAANYLLKHLPRPGLGIGGSLVGYLEMGGATAQIAYIPTDAELEQDGNSYTGNLLRLKLWGREHDLYLRSYKLGANSAWDVHQKALAFQQHGGRVDDPCRPKMAPKRPTMPPGQQWYEVAELHNIDVIGRGNYQLSKQLARLLLAYQYRSDETAYQGAIGYPPGRYPRTNPPEAVVEADYTPSDLLEGAPWLPEDGNRQFVGGANFWYTTRSTFGCDAWGHPKEQPYTLAELEAEVSSNCNYQWENLLQEKLWKGGSNSVSTDYEQFLIKSVFMAAWVTATLHHGFGFPTEGGGLSFQPFDGPTRRQNDQRPELTWTLGVAVIEAIQRTRPVDDNVIRVIKVGDANAAIPDNVMEDSTIWDQWNGLEV